MSDDTDFPFPFAFGEGAGEEFKERLKELMRAQREAFEEMQAETGGQAGRDRPLAGDPAGGGPRLGGDGDADAAADARRGRRRDGPALRPLDDRAPGGAPPERLSPGGAA